jgi:Myb-like DNA-binding protein FlbD
MLSPRLCHDAWHQSRLTSRTVTNHPNNDSPASQEQKDQSLLIDAATMVAHRRGPWSQHEDQWLVNLVARNGPHNWVRISQEIASRSPKQCRERYHQNLKPTLNHDPITPEEGELIEKMVAEMGKRWAEIARRLKGRSDNAVKNWWNGGQNRRKRNPERPDQRPHDHIHPTHAGYHYPPVPHHEEHHLQSYHNSRRPSINPLMDSPHGMKLPQPQRFDPYPGSRPQPLDISSYGHPSTARARGIETPMPSPSGYSVVSADGAPSLITDTGSESRSPRGVASPLDITLAPLVGSRDERKNSSTRYLPVTGFAPEDDSYPAQFDAYRSRGSLQLPPLHRTEVPAATRAPAFREPNYERPQRPQLLTQPAPQLVHHHSLPQSTPLSVSQRALPAFHSLAEPTLPTSAAASPQLPSPYARPALPTQSQSAPVSPKDRMSLKNIM